MRSASAVETADDKTAQAKIRDAAIARFPRDGLNGTTVRAIAKDAGVSPGLVIHHFGSKAGLHRACDEHVVHLIAEMKREALATGSYRSGNAIAELYTMSVPAIRYIAWTLATGNETASRIFDELLDEAVELLEAGKDAGTIGEIYGDPRKQAAVLVSMQFAGLVFHDHLTRAFGLDMLSSEGLTAAAPYTLQIFSGDLFNQDVIAETRTALKQLELNQEDTQ